MKPFETFEEHIEHVEAWLGGKLDRHAGKLLKARGIKVVPAAKLNDAQLTAALREVIDALAAERIYLENTDHLSDRELYERIRRDVLTRSYAVAGDNWDAHDFSDVYDDVTRDIYLTHYADDISRKMYEENGVAVPPKRPTPYDRDKTLPRPEEILDFGFAQPEKT